VFGEGHVARSLHQAPKGARVVSIGVPAAAVSLHDTQKLAIVGMRVIRGARSPG
jgi:hypothetical protein